MTDVFMTPLVGDGPSVQPESCGSDTNDYAEAIDLLVVWVVEDAKAVAKSFCVPLSKVLEMALAKARADISLFEDDIDPED